MEKVPIGVIIKRLVDKNNLSAKYLADKTGLTRQGVYATFKRAHMHEGDLEKWANVLNVTVQDLLMTNFASDLPNKSADNGSFGNEVLQNIQKLLEEEIKEKNEQIRALQEALKESQQMAKALLGKSREYPTNAVIPDHMNGMFWATK
jgi:transcriptional regulator with XRE-family HTH domain